MQGSPLPQLFAALFQAGGQPSGSFLWSILPLVFIFAIFYFILIAPQQRQRKKWKEMVDGVKSGDRVLTTGGIRGTVISVKDDYVHLRVPPDNLRLELLRTSILSVYVPEDKA